MRYVVALFGGFFAVVTAEPRQKSNSRENRIGAKFPHQIRGGVDAVKCVQRGFMFLNRTPYNQKIMAGYNSNLKAVTQHLDEAKTSLNVFWRV